MPSAAPDKGAYRVKELLQQASMQGHAEATKMLKIMLGTTKPGCDSSPQGPPEDFVNKDTRKLKFVDRMELVQNNKGEAAELFKGGNIEQAASCWSEALNHCN